jgi:hypothetical protein
LHFAVEWAFLHRSIIDDIASARADLRRPQ